MQPLLVHYCNVCSYNTTVLYSASVFSQNQACAHCGAISVGINLRNEQEEQKEKVMARNQQEELARLFAAQMSLSQNQPQAVAPAPSEPEPQMVAHPEEQPQPAAQPITYVSQHYTHTHHVARVPGGHRTQFDDAELAEILMRHEVDPSALFPSQVELFRNADDEQRLRLLELWRISPPTGRQGVPQGMDYAMSRQLYDWPPTSLAQEEAMAKLRYEKTMENHAQKEAIEHEQQVMDQSMQTVSSAPDSTAAQETRTNLLTDSSEARNAEPYMVSGYEMMARREYEESARSAEHALKESSNYNQATDPVYNANAQGWQKNVGSILDMENQYGAFAAAREHDGPHIYGDYEMVM